MNRALAFDERLAVAAVLGAMALAVLDAGMANLALPSLGRHFAVGPSDVIIVVGAYQAALLAGLMPAAHLAAKIGHRRLFRAGIVTFAASGLLAALAPDLQLLAIARAFQGLGGAAIMALGIAVLRTKLGEPTLPRTIAWNALTVAISAASGPMVGAMLLSFLAPQMLFAAGLPIAIGAFFASAALDQDERRKASIDRFGISLHMLTVAAFLGMIRFFLEVPLAGLTSFAVALFASLATAKRARTQAEPLFPLDLLRRRAFAVQSAASIACFLAQSTGLIALSYALQSTPDRNAPTIGFLMACWPVSVALANVALSRLGRQIDTSVMCVAGAVTMMFGLIVIALTAGWSGWLGLAAGAVLCGLGFGVFQLANNRALFLGAPAERSAAAGGMQGTARLGGQTLGTFLAAVLFSIIPPTTAPLGIAAAGAASALLAALFSFSAGRARSGHSRNCFEPVMARR